MIRTTIKMMISLAVLAGLVVVGVTGCGEDSPSQVVEDFVQASIDNDCEAVVDMLHLGEEMQGVTKDDLVESCKQAGLSPEGTELVSVETSDEEIDGDKASVMAKTTIRVEGEELSEEQEISLIKVDGEWKIDISAMLVPPDTTAPETVAPEAPAAPDATVPETTVPEAAVPEAAAPVQ